MDTRRSKLLCNNTMQMYIKRISLVRYMIVLSCAKGSSYIRKKYRILLISGVNYFPALPSPLVLPIPIEGIARVFKIEILSLLAHTWPDATCGLRFELYICDRVLSTRYAIPLSILAWQLYRSRARFLLITLMFARPYRRGLQFC